MKLMMEHPTHGTALRAPGRIVLWFDPANERAPYLTTWQNLKDEALYWKHYFDSRKTAIADFQDRAKLWAQVGELAA